MIPPMTRRDASSHRTRNFAYSWGSFANSISQQAFTNRVQFFYLEVVGLSAATVGWIWALFGLWNAVNDPLMGNVSDRTRWRRGRRIPYLRWFALPLGASFLLIFTPPDGAPLLAAAWFLVSVFVFDTLLTLLTLATNALFPEIASSVEERSSIAAMREGLTVLALLLAFVLAPILSEQVGWWQMGLVIGLITAVGYIVSTLGVHEVPLDPNSPRPHIGDGFRDAFALPSFRWYLWANLAKEYVFVILAATLPLWRRYALGIDGEVDTFLGTLGPGEAEAVILGVTFVLAVPFLWMWKRITPRIGVARAWLYASVVMLPGLVMLALSDDFMSGALAAWLVAPGLAGYMMSPIVALSEVIDIDAVAGKERREGLFFGINGAVGKLAFTLQGVLLGVLLSATDYDSAIDVQPEAAVDAIRFLMGWSPAIATVLAIWFLYGLDRSLRVAKDV
jgi:GPH family glycoside/pentoside/hexuronide:cation symporter